MIIERTIKILNKHGLHVRPAREFVEEALKYVSDISVAKDGREVDAKSMLSLMTLDADCGSIITMKADGSDAQQALDALTRIVTGQFGEE